MNRKTLVSLLAMTIIPLGVIAWLSISQMMNVQIRLDQQQRVLWQKEIDGTIQKIEYVLLETEKDLVTTLNNPASTVEEWRKLSWQAPLIRQAFYLNNNQRLYYPDSNENMTTEERDFLTRTSLLWSNDAVLYSPSLEEEQIGKTQSSPLNSRASSGKRKKNPTHGLFAIARTQNQGWIPWFWEDGLHLLFWMKTSSGIIGAEVERTALIARIIGELPDGTNGKSGTVLCDGGGRGVYQWGRIPNPLGTPSYYHMLPDPFHTWSIKHFTISQNLPVQPALFWQGAILVIVFFGLIISTWAFFRSSTQSLKEAEHRVQFVNQVSHELKTPLTNIRLYAELLEDEILDEETIAQKQLRVIQSETQRLSRLIHNILTFSNLKKSRITLHKKMECIDTIIQNSLAPFKPSLEKLEINVSLDLNAPETILLDPDAAGQIMANLISNVEKYGKDGKFLGLRSTQSKSLITVWVWDKGPGIHSDSRRHIFKQYFRASDSVTEGVSGTGIGLSIARELALLHGGDLQLDTTDQGAKFCWTIPIFRSHL